MLRLASILRVLPLTVILMGCGGETGPSLDLASAEGIVTLDGTALPNALVTFYPENGRPATGRTDDQGHFELMTKEPGDGAMIGSHKVTVILNPSAESTMNSEDPYAIPDPSTKKDGIPVKYGDASTSGLTADVTADGENKFAFDLEK
ncbi:MAG: hypothetical protein P8M30_01745 [Planctomycetaceae bacterium]|jgi:hypothetical protein|nr:hypothetical protein [Planctomycetaceae bacterium]MDG2388018.1 hypothetical protein [Planctomycetaceae bacterium]